LVSWDHSPQAQTFHRDDLPNRAGEVSLKWGYPNYFWKPGIQWIPWGAAQFIDCHGQQSTRNLNFTKCYVCPCRLVTPYLVLYERPEEVHPSCWKNHSYKGNTRGICRDLSCSFLGGSKKGLQSEGPEALSQTSWAGKPSGATNTSAATRGNKQDIAKILGPTRFKR
jgi:hypothetical protein